MATDGVLVSFPLGNFVPPDPDPGDPLSEELDLPAEVAAARDLAPTVSVVLEAGRLTVLVRRRRRGGTAGLTATVRGRGGEVATIPLDSRGTWLHGAAAWPGPAVPVRLDLIAAAPLNSWGMPGRPPPVG